MLEPPFQSLYKDISRAVAPDEFDDAARHELTEFDKLSRSYAPQLACREGCSLCCWLKVDLFAHEAFLLARHIQLKFRAEEMARLLSRLAVHSGMVMTLTPFQHATQNIRCPLLVDGRCSVYEARPHACRRHHSRDFSACQYTFDHPTDLEFPSAHDRELFQQLSHVMQQGIEAYDSLGFDSTIYELGTALLEALTDPTAWNRWQRREKAFQTASVTPCE